MTLKNKKLYVMVGIPGSGKSYKAQKLKSEGVEYVSRDEVRFSILKEGDHYFSKEEEVFREFVKRIQSALDSGKSAIADATHINTPSRAKLLKHLNIDSDTNVVAVYCDTDFDTCRERNSKRTGRAKVPDNSLINMYVASQEPRKNEGFDLVIKLSEEE